MRGKKRLYLTMASLFAGAMLTFGCAKDTPKQKVPVETEEMTTTEEARYNTKDLVIIKEIDTQKCQISVQSVNGNGKSYVLNYFNGTSFKNKYDTELLANQLELGEICDAYYISGTQKLITLKESGEAWENDEVTRWDADFDEKKMSIGEENYIYEDDLFVVSGKNTIKIENISGVDTLSVRGIGNKIYSINVKVGHGYIKLTDTANFIGGMVEVGGKIMTVITEDMVIAAPEGEHTLSAWKNGNGGTVTINVKRDDDLYVSLSGFNGEIEKNGAVKFNILPGDAKVNVFVDGKEVDITEVVDLEYGSHKLLISSDKYEDYTEKFVVSSIYTNKTVDISNKGTSDDEDETKKDGEQETVEKETGEKESGEKETGKSRNNKLIITQPEGASVYMDGIFVGTIPLTTEKQSGEHVVILRQTGFQSVVYNVSFSEDKNDVTLKFPKMEGNEEETTR